MSVSTAAVATLYCITATLSLICTLIYISLYLRHSKIRTFSSSLYFSLALTDTFASLSHYLVGTSSGTLCTIQAATQQFFYLSSFAFLTIIATHTYLCVHGESTPYKWSPFYSFVGWYLPAILTFIPLVSGAMGPTDEWCWITINNIGHRYFSFYLPLLLTIITISYLYSISMVHISTNIKTTQVGKSSILINPSSLDKSARILFNDWIFFLILFIILRLPSIIHRAQEWQKYNYSISNNTTYAGASDGWILLHAICSPLQSALNLILAFSKYKPARRVLDLAQKHSSSLLGRLLYTGDEDVETPFVSDLSAHALRILSIPPSLLLPPVSLTPQYSIAPSSAVHSLWTGTWNMGNKRPSDNLSSFLPMDGTYDIIALSVQECHYYYDKSQQTLIGRVTHTIAHTHLHWLELVYKHIGMDKYTIISSSSIHHIRLIIFIKNHLYHRVHNVRLAEEGTGIFNVYGNKGGVCILFTLDDIIYNFINVHLAAHLGDFNERNKDFIQVLSHLSGQLNVPDILNYSHVTFLLGDLNYRLLSSKHEVINWLSDHRFSYLLEEDELNILMKSNTLFYGFNENMISFPPTYKYLVKRKKLSQSIKVGDGLTLSVKGVFDIVDVETGEVISPSSSNNKSGGNNTMDSEILTDNEKKKRTQAYTLKRIPAYCDRILYKYRSIMNVHQHDYMHVPTISTSDHKPVIASFTVGFSMPSREKCIINYNNKLKVSTDAAHSSSETEDEEEILITNAETGVREKHYLQTFKSSKDKKFLKKKKSNKKEIINYDPIQDYYKLFSQYTTHEYDLYIDNVELYDCITPYSFSLIHPYLRFECTAVDSIVTFNSTLAKAEEDVHIPLIPRINTEAPLTRAISTISLMNAHDQTVIEEEDSKESDVISEDDNETDYKLPIKEEEGETSLEDRNNQSKNRQKTFGQEKDRSVKRKLIDDIQDAEEEELEEQQQKSLSGKKSLAGLLPSISDGKTKSAQIKPKTNPTKKSQYNNIENEFDDDDYDDDISPTLPSQRVLRPPPPPPPSPPSIPPPPITRITSKFHPTSSISISVPPPPSTKVCEWSGDQLPVFPLTSLPYVNISSISSIPSTPPILSLSRQQLSIIINDRSWLGEESEYIGSASIELSEGMTGTWKEFMVPVSWYTRYNGYLRGRIVIREKKSGMAVRVIM